MLRKRINLVQQYIAERENEICEPFTDKEFKQSMKFYKNKKAKPSSIKSSVEITKIIEKLNTLKIK